MNKFFSLVDRVEAMMPESIKEKVRYVPKLLLCPFAKLPAKLQEQVIAVALNNIFKQAIADEELDFLENKWLAINITDAHYLCFISLTKGKEAKLTVKVSIDSQPDVEFSATTQALALLMNKQEDPDTLFFKRDLMVTGDTELGLEIKNLLDDLELQQIPETLQFALHRYCKYLNA